MTAQIRERVPARVRRAAPDTGEYQPTHDLTARRFMGVLVHPVPRHDMQVRCGVYHQGGRVVVEWPSRMMEDRPVRPGDQLEVGGKTYRVRATKELPLCFLEIYVDL